MFGPVTVTVEPDVIAVEGTGQPIILQMRVTLTDVTGLQHQARQLIDTRHLSTRSYFDIFWEDIGRRLKQQIDDQLTKAGVYQPKG